MGEATEKLEVEDRLLGQVVNDRYRIVSVIARGGMGKVYEAEQLPLGRRVAFKVLDPKHTGEGDPEFHKRFFLEAATAAKLSHPNTVTIFDYGHSQDGLYFIAMELVKGRTLSAILKSEGPMDADRAIQIAMQICRSLREAHGCGVIHRDLKPANVLLTTHADERDFVKVLDFGLVKNMAAGEDSELTKAGMFMGSPKYMSPEQIQGGAVDARSDIYSLGVILYQVLTGDVPFEGPSAVQTLMLHMQNAVPAMNGEGRPYVPPMLEQIVLRCLAKQPADRFGTMNELLLALKQVGASLGMAVPLSTSFGASSGDIQLSGTRSLGTPADGMLVQSPPAGMPTPSHVRTREIEPPASTQVEIVEVDVAPRRSKWLPLAIAAVLAVAVAAFLFARPTDQARSAPDETGGGTAAAAPRAPSSAPSEPAPPPQHILVNLRSDPAGAMVHVGDATYGPTPAQVEWIGAEAEAGREVTFRFELDGHEPATVVRTLGGDELDVEATLEPDAPRRPFHPRPTPMQAEPAPAAPSGMNGVRLPGDYLQSPY